MKQSPYYTIDIVERTTQLILERFDVSAEYAKRLALGALNGIESHGGDSTDWQSIDNTVRSVVASWVENRIDFPNVVGEYKKEFGL